MAIAIGRKKRKPAVREFTDRTEPRKAFWTRFQKMESDGSTLITFYGAGGVGKSSLLRKLQDEIISSQRNDLAFVCGDFEKNSESLSMLQGMRRELESQGCIFPLFSTGEFYYFLNTGQKNELDAPKIESVMDKNSWLSKVKKNWAKPVAIVDFFLPGANALATGVSIIGNALINHWKSQDNFDEEHRDIKARLDAARLEKNPYEIYKLLPELFAQDVKDWLISSGKYLVVFLDTYEAIVNEAVAATAQRSRDAWLRSETGEPTGIIFLIPNTLWVIAGRNKLRWEGDLAAELDQHLITALSQDDSNYFLTKAGIATQTLRDEIYHLTKGLPIFLDVCVDVYTEYKQRNGIEPDISIFGKRREEIIERLVKYMDDGTQDMIKFLCGLGRWTDKLAFELGTKIFNFSQTTYRKIKNFSFIQDEDFLIDDIRVENFSTTVFSLDRSIKSILFPTCDEMIIDKTKAVADKYFSELLEELPFEGEYIFNLEYWARLTVRLAETPEELRERYEKNFEEDVTDFEEILAWYDIAERLLKIFMDEFTDEAGKFKGFQESVAFAYLEGELGSLKNEQGLYQKAFDYQQNSYERFLRLLGEKHPDTCQTMNVLANTLDNLGRYDEALALQEKVLALSKEIFGEDSYETITALSNLAVTLNDLGRYDEALKLQERILAWRKENLEEDDEDTLTAMNNLANTLNDLGRYDEALRLQEKNLALSKELFDEKYPGTIDAMHNLSRTLDDLGRYDEALALQEQVLTLRKEILGDEHPDTLTAMQNLAVTLSYFGRYDEALELEEEVLTLSKNILGDEHPYTLTAMNNLAKTLSDLERYDEALELEKQVLTLRKKILSDEHPDTINAMQNLSVTLNYLERYDEALTLQEEVLTLLKKILGDEHPDTLTAMNNLALTLGLLERDEEALPLYEKVLAFRMKTLGEDDEDTVDAMENLAMTLDDLERYDEALPLYEKVLAFRIETLGEDDEDTIDAMENLAMTLDDLERHDEALKFRRQVFKLRKNILGAEDEETISAMNNLAMTLNDVGNEDEARKIIKRALNLGRKILPADDELIVEMTDTYKKIFEA